MTPLDYLRQLCSAQQTGVLFAVTEDKRQIRIGIDAGAVVHVGYGPRRGKAALDLITYSKIRSAAFTAGNTLLRDDDLPAADDIWRVLTAVLANGEGGINGHGSESPLAGARQSAPKTLSGRTTAPPTAAGGSASTTLTNGSRAHAGEPIRLTSANIESLTALLAERIGPIAELLVQQETTRAATARELMETLGREIEDAGERRGFLEQASSLLRG